MPSFHRIRDPCDEITMRLPLALLQKQRWMDADPIREVQVSLAASARLNLVGI